MTNALRSGVAAAPESSEFEADHTLEDAAFAGAAAIQRLIADRNRLQACSTTQKRELEAMKRDLEALNAINEELRRRLNFIRNQYIELGMRIVSHLEQFQGATRDAMREKEGAEKRAENGDHEAYLGAAVQRFKHEGLLNQA
jgi:predicted  nucleic acid-binding Zn-ribbon protein